MIESSTFCDKVCLDKFIPNKLTWQQGHTVPKGSICTSPSLYHGHLVSFKYLESVSYTHLRAHET